jgi:hypothetical protein
VDCHQADAAQQIEQSHGLMVNYLYELDDIEKKPRSLCATPHGDRCQRGHLAGQRLGPRRGSGGGVVRGAIEYLRRRCRNDAHYLPTKVTRRLMLGAGGRHAKQELTRPFESVDSGN